MSLDPDFLAPRLIILAIMLLVAFPVHEFCHALAAYRLGDGTAKLMGRLTLDPRAHFDPIGALFMTITIFIGFGIGWAKPTPVNPLNLQGGRQGEAIVAFAGPASNLVLASIAALAFRYLDLVDMEVPALLFQSLLLFIFINVLLMVFNLLPIPPLDGSKVLFAFLSPQTSWRWRPVLEQYGLLLLLVAVFLPFGPGGRTLFGLVVDFVIYPMVGLLTGLSFD